MAKLSSYRRIIRSDYPEEFQPLIEQLSVSVNNGFDTLFNAVNGKLNFSENIASTITEVRISVDADGNPLQRVQFKVNEKITNVEGILVLKITGYNNSNLYAKSGLAISYIYSNGVVTINNIKGLEANQIYLVKLLVIN